MLFHDDDNDDAPTCRPIYRSLHLLQLVLGPGLKTGLNWVPQAFFLVSSQSNENKLEPSLLFELVQIDLELDGEFLQEGACDTSVE